jgi:hypothetical protein
VSPRAATDAADAPVIRIGAGQYFGEIALFVDIPRTAGIQALEDSLLLELRKSDYQVRADMHILTHVYTEAEIGTELRVKITAPQFQLHRPDDWQQPSIIASSNNQKSNIRLESSGLCLRKPGRNSVSQHPYHASPPISCFDCRPIKISA